MITTYTCPDCRRMLRTVEPLPGGTRVQCPQCRAEFETPEDVAEPPPAPRAANVPAVPRAGARLVDEGWQNPSSATDTPATYPRRTSPTSRNRPAANSSRKLVLTFVIICLSLAFLVLIIAMAQRKSQSTPSQHPRPIATPAARLHGEWELVEVNGRLPFRKILEFHKDGSARMSGVVNQQGNEILFRYQVAAENELVIDGFDLHGARQVVTIYRIEWLANGEVQFVDTQFGDNFRWRRVR
jgi:hypothetical protein